jgi:two-component system sensor histidine kinase/response regulator
MSAERPRDQLQGILEHTTTRIAVKDREGRYLLVNHAWKRTARLDGTGRTDAELFAPEVANQAQHTDTEVWSTGMTLQYERRIGDTTELVVKFPLRDAAGDIYAIGSIATDISERNRELAEARAVSHPKSEFVAKMSDEIRTPLNGVIDMLELLKDTPLTDEQRTLVDTALASGDALLGAISNVLDFSKIEAGKLDLEERAFDPRDTVEATCAMLAPQAQTKGVELTLFVDESVPRRLRGDEVRLRQAVANLLSNAIKFTVHGEVSVDVEADRPDDGRALLRVQVCDTGIGIAPQQLATLVEPFIQADTSTTRRFAGTGLGLAISRRLVSIMGGELTAESQPGRGSAFDIRIPFEVVDAGRPSRRSRVMLRPDTHVLVVDDNATNREILRAYLGGRVAECAVASGGAEALAMLEAAHRSGRPYELAVLDAGMPEMSGVEVARAIRADPALQSCKLVLLTSAGASAHPSEVDRFLTKPVRRAALLETLAEALAAEPVAPPAPAPSAVPLRRRVLVAEDNPVNQLVIETLLRRRGFAVDLAATGPEVIERLDPEHHDAIFMECELPILSGYAATVRIRAAEPAGRHIPIVAVGAHAFASDRERCLRAGMDDYLSKPLRSEDLDAVLERWLGQATPMRQENSLIDGERLRSVRDVRPGLVDRLVDAFARTTPPLLDELRLAVERSDDDTSRHLAHKLGGSSDTIGAHRLAALAGAIETGHDASAAAAELEPVYRDTLDELQRVGAASRRA